MAIGKRIRFFRRQKGMTQRQTGELLGFPEKTSDVRMAQYESEARTPKRELVEKMARLFEVSPSAITVPDIDSPVGLMHTLFALEDMYGLKIENLFGELCLCPPAEGRADFPALSGLFAAWHEQALRLKRGEISKEAYDAWRHQYAEPECKALPEEAPPPIISDEAAPDAAGRAGGQAAQATESYYLIDYENVNENGLLGAEKLGKGDYIHLFFTKNAKKISIDRLPDLNLVPITPHQIPAGSQSLDMHLSSYLGYLVGANSDKHRKYIIVSKDTDYDNVIAFWKKQNGCNVSRRVNIANSSPPASAKQHKAAADSALGTLTLLNNQAQQALSKAGVEGDRIGKIASIVVKSAAEKDFVQAVQSQLKKKHPADHARLYEIVEPVISRFRDALPTQQASPPRETAKEAQTPAPTVSQKTQPAASILRKKERFPYGKRKQIRIPARPAGRQPHRPGILRGGIHLRDRRQKCGLRRPAVLCGQRPEQRLRRGVRGLRPDRGRQLLL